MEDKMIIQAPAFNRDYFEVGKAVRIIFHHEYEGDFVWDGIVKNIERDKISVIRYLTEVESKIEVVNIYIGDVISKIYEIIKL